LNLKKKKERKKKEEKKEEEKKNLLCFRKNQILLFFIFFGELRFFQIFEGIMVFFFFSFLNLGGGRLAH
jgi:Na+/melibiose symporter-like transporter